MKERDIVTLVNFNEIYKENNLYKGVNGIVLKNITNEKSLVVFFNDRIIGDYALVEVNNSDLKLEKEKIPSEYINEIEKMYQSKQESLLKKKSFNVLKFKECDFVELLVEDEKYTKEGIHKGDRGVVAIDYMVEDSILVDFSVIDENGECFGDCIPIKVEHLKLV